MMEDEEGTVRETGSDIRACRSDQFLETCEL